MIGFSADNSVTRLLLGQWMKGKAASWKLVFYIIFIVLRASLERE